MKSRYNPQDFFNLLNREILFSDLRSKTMPMKNAKGLVTGIRANEVELCVNNNITSWYSLNHPYVDFILTPIRKYVEKIEFDGDCEFFDVEAWEECVRRGCFNTSDGSGYWCKDGFINRDEVFSSPMLDATHVMWFNK